MKFDQYRARRKGRRDPSPVSAIPCKFPIRGGPYFDVFSVVHCLEKGVEGLHGPKPHYLPVFQINIDVVEHRQQQAIALTGVGCFP
ncbi:MAG: hypothetical protein OXE87_02760 [Chloroflexi bacterium]|nr:hypothetical protein [Chloroflexota bacterium]